MASVIQFENAEEFYQWCVDHDACTDGLAGIKGLTAAEWWATTKDGDWMAWLIKNRCVVLTRDESAEYWRQRFALLPEYERKRDPHWSGCERRKANAIRAVLGNPFADVAHG